MKTITHKKSPWPYFLIQIIVTIFTIGIIWLFYYFNPFSKPQLTIGSTYMTMNNDFYPVLNEQVANYINNKHDILINRDPALNIDKQVQEIHSFTKKHVSAIILNPINSDSPKIANAVKKAAKNGIKVIVVDNPLKDDRYVTCTIMSNNYQAGVLDAKQLFKNRKRAKILLLTQTDVSSARQRIAGFVDTIKKTHNKNYKIVGRINTNGQSEFTYPKICAYIRQNRNFNTMMTLNDKVAVGALAALKKEKHEHNTQLYSVDGSRETKQIMGINPCLKATIAQSPITIGKTAIRVAYRAINDKPVKHRILTPVKTITAKNINQFNLTGWQ